MAPVASSGAAILAHGNLDGTATSWLEANWTFLSLTFAIVGLGAKGYPLQASRYSRQRAFPPDFTTCRNCPDRTLVEAGRETLATRPKPWTTQRLPTRSPSPSAGSSSS